MYDRVLSGVPSRRHVYSSGRSQRQLGVSGEFRDFTAWVIRIAPVFLILSLCGRRKTRLLSFLWIVAVVLDCIFVDMMA